MILSAWLIAYSVLVLVAGPRVLVPLSRSGNAPRCGVVAWVAAVGGALLACVVTVVLFTHDVIAYWAHLDPILRSCIRILCDLATGYAGREGQFVVLLASTLAVVSAGRQGTRICRNVVRSRAQGREHAQAVRLVGRRDAEHGVYIIDAPQRTVYCVAGRPATIVVTSAALDALDPRQLAAVIAHERAHLAGHHTALVMTLRGLATVFPGLPLVAQAAREVPRLLEMSADNAAARRHGHQALLDGMLALVGGPPNGGLGAADVAILGRARRLLSPPTLRARTAARVGLTTVATIITLTPISLIIFAIIDPWC